MYVICREFIFVQSQRISLLNLERFRLCVHLTALGVNLPPFTDEGKVIRDNGLVPLDGRKKLPIVRCRYFCCPTLPSCDRTENMPD